MPSYALASDSVTLDGAGAGMLEIGPSIYGTYWHVDRITTSCTAGMPGLQVFRSVATPSALLDTTRHGEAAVSETSLDLRPPDKLVCVYTGGTPGSVATISVTGEQKGIR